MQQTQQKKIHGIRKIILMAKKIDNEENRMSKTDQAISNFKGIADSLTDEVIELQNGKKQFVQYVNGNPNHKKVIGSSRRGKSIISGVNAVSQSDERG